ncbi:MAG: hypothetical protein PUA61_05855 [Succinatimonas hippei]|nr:hypothetical protein [Succinatimonas hippei]
MDASEIKTAAGETGGIQSARSGQDSANRQVNEKALINVKAASKYLALLSRDRTLVSDGLKRTLNSVQSTLNSYIQDKDKIKSAANSSGLSGEGELTRLSSRVIARDSALSENVAEDLSTKSKLVRQRDAATEFGKTMSSLPPALKEDTAAGSAISKTIAQSLLNLTDHETLGAGLERDLAVRGIYVPEQELSQRSREATSRVLQVSLAFAMSNSPEVLESLPPDESEPKKETPGSTTPQIMTRYLRRALNEFPDDSTYLDIFKKNREASESEQEDKVSEETIERIHNLIVKAAQSARRGNLIPGDAQTDESGNSDVSEKIASTGSAAPRSARGDTANRADSAEDARGLSLSELSERASRLQRQFRLERQKLASEGQMPDPAEYPKSATIATAKTDSDPDDSSAGGDASDIKSSSQSAQRSAVPSETPEKKGSPQNGDTDNNARVSLENSQSAGALSNVKDGATSGIPLENASVNFSYKAIQNQFFGGISSAPGITIPVTDFDNKSLLGFAARELLQDFTTPRTINRIIKEQEELLSREKAQATSLRADNPDSQKSAASDAGAAATNTTIVSKISENSAEISKPDAAIADKNARALKTEQTAGESARPHSETNASAQIIPSGGAPSENSDESGPKSESAVSSSSLASSASAVNSKSMMASGEVSEDPSETSDKSSLAVSEVKPDEVQDAVREKAARKSTDTVIAKPGESSAPDTESKSGAIGEEAEDQRAIEPETAPEPESQAKAAQDEASAVNQQDSTASTEAQRPDESVKADPETVTIATGATVAVNEPVSEGTTGDETLESSYKSSSQSSEPQAKFVASATASESTDPAAATVSDEKTPVSAGAKAGDTISIPDDTGKNIPSDTTDDNTAVSESEDSAQSGKAEPSAFSDKEASAVADASAADDEAGSESVSAQSAVISPKSDEYAGAPSQSASPAESAPAEPEQALTSKAETDTDNAELSADDKNAAENSRTNPVSESDADATVSGSDGFSDKLESDPYNTANAAVTANDLSAQKTTQTATTIATDSAETDSALKVPLSDLKTSAAAVDLVAADEKSRLKAAGSSSLSENEASADADAEGAARLGDSIMKGTVPASELDDSDTPDDAPDLGGRNVGREVASDIDTKSEASSEASSSAKDAVASSPLKTPAAAAVTTGGSAPLPDESVITNPQGTVKEGGFLSRLVSLFSSSKNQKSAQTSVQLQQLASGQSQILRESPLDRFVSELTTLGASAFLPPEVRKEAKALKAKLLDPVADLSSVNSWLEFVAAPMSPTSARAVSMHQWAFFILCLRFRELGKSVDKFLKKNGIDINADSVIDDMLLSHQDDEGAGEKLCDDTLSQISRMQQLSSQGAQGFFNRVVPLPPAYDGGQEGSLSLKRESKKDGRKIWHLEFAFDLENTGPIGIRAVASFPEIRLSYVAKTMEGLQALQKRVPELERQLEELGLEPKSSGPRLGHIEGMDRDISKDQPAVLSKDQLLNVNI